MKRNLNLSDSTPVKLVPHRDKRRKGPPKRHKLPFGMCRLTVHKSISMMQSMIGVLNAAYDLNIQDDWS